MFWRKVDSGLLQPSGKANAIFRERNFWKTRNTRNETSRDRYTNRSLEDQIAELESQFAALGYGPNYCAQIYHRATSGRDGVRALHSYINAMKRTLKSKLGAPREKSFAV